MANLNKVMLIGRLTRDPETRVFASGGKLATFGFAVNNRKKNTQTGQWEDEPVFIDVKTFNRGEKGRPLADLVEQHMRKGQQFYLEGHLQFEQWTGQDGQKRSKLVVMMDEFQFFEPRQDANGSPRSASPARKPVMSPPMDEPYDAPAEMSMNAPPAGRTEEDIPF